MNIDGVDTRVRLAVTMCSLALSLSGCGSSTALLERGDVTAYVQNAHVYLVNDTALPVFATVFGANATAKINWAACVDAAQCPPIAKGATGQLTYPVPLLGAQEREAVVYWWHATRGSDGALHPDRIRAVLVRL